LIGFLGAFAFAKNQKPIKWPGFVLAAFRKAAFL
jgi:hypothetical protein